MAIDGRFFKASANRFTVHTKKELAREVSRLDVRIETDFKALQERLDASGEKPLSEIAFDARHLHKSGKSVVGYNGPIAIDDQSKLIGAGRS